jgi:PKD repeat protein
MAGRERRRMRRIAVAGAVVGVVLVGSPRVAGAAFPSTSTPTLRLDRTIRTNPFVSTSTRLRDGEGSAYVPSDNSLWLIEDVGAQAVEVDATTGALKRLIPRNDFSNAPQLGGGAAAGSNRSGDLESMAYDPTTDTLYAFSGKCCTSSALPTAYRLTRGGNGAFRVESHQPLPSSSDFTGAAVRPTDGKLYVGASQRLRQYTYATNTVGSSFALSGVTGIYGLAFSSDGADVLVVGTDKKLYRVNWSSRAVVSGWVFDLGPFGVGDSRGVEVVNDRLFVLDGYDSRSSSDPLKYAVYVFSVIGTGDPPVAAFSGTPTTGTAPLTVNFTDNSAGNPTSWSWTFGDGATSTAQNPSHAYTQANTYTVSLTVTNAGGSHTLTRTGYVVVTPADSTAPDTTIDTGPSGTTSGTSATFTFSANEASTFECRLDAAAFAPCTSPATYSALAPTQHTFEVRAIDTAGNTDPTPAARTWTVTDVPDTIPPDTSIDSGPSGTTGATTATFSFSASEASTFECRLDTAGFAPCTSPLNYAGLSAAVHTFEVRATDTAGLTDPSPAARTWTVAPSAAGIVRERTSTTVNTTAVSSLTVATPTGTNAGDVLVACIALNGGTVRTAPAGWTQLAAVTAIANPHVYGFYKVAGASEPSHTWTLSAAVANSGGIARYSGVNTGAPLDVAPATATTATESTAVAVPGVTTTSAGAMLVGCVGINSSATTVTLATPTGLTEAWDVGGKRQELADGRQAAAGATGTKTWTSSSGRASAGWLAALRPA